MCEEVAYELLSSFRSTFCPCSISPPVLVPFHLLSLFHFTSCPRSIPPQDETIGPDPFYDLEQHALLGVANISLECLLHDIEFVYDAPIVAPTGKVCLSLSLAVKTVYAVH